MQAGRLCEQGGDGSVGVDLRQGEICGAQGDPCLLYTSDAADERSSVDLGGRRIIKKKKQERRSVEGHV